MSGCGGRVVIRFPIPTRHPAVSAPIRPIAVPTGPSGADYSRRAGRGVHARASPGQRTGRGGGGNGERGKGGGGLLARVPSGWGASGDATSADEPETAGSLPGVEVRFRRRDSESGF